MLGEALALAEKIPNVMEAACARRRRAGRPAAGLARRLKRGTPGITHRRSASRDSAVSFLAGRGFDCCLTSASVAARATRVGRTTM